MTENEKCVVTLLSRQGPLSKRELAEKGKISWATVIKIVSRFEQAGILRHGGIGSQPGTTGKDPVVYDLSDRAPLAIGIDVSYSMTHIILTNLKNEVLAQDSYKTPKTPNKAQCKDFLITIFSQFSKDALTEDDSLSGVGIGIPRWLVKHERPVFAELTHELSAKLQTAVSVENSIWSYTLYEKWIGKAFSLNNFILVALRDGVGTGIFYEGNLFRGFHGGAGGLSHLTVIEDGEPCRCGKKGCLETLINQDILYQHYIKKVLNNDPAHLPTPSETEMHHGLAKLFSLAKQGHSEALAAIHDAARYIGIGLAALLLILDIPHIFIAADFGPDGAVILPHIEQEIDRRITSDIDYSLMYHPLEWPGFAQGAPLLIFKEYFTEIDQIPSR